MSFVSPPWPKSSLLHLFTLSLFLIQFPSHVRAIGVQFTQPNQDATFPAGPVNVTWQDAGGSPDMSMLTNYQLDLIVGGNLGPQDSDVAQTLVEQGLVSDGHTTVNISSNAAQSIQNGFYLRMTSNATDGRTVLNYSGRFTLIGMTGQTDAIYVQGAAAFVGGSNTPAAQVNVPVPASSSSAQNTSTVDSTTPTSLQPSDESSSKDSSGIGTGAIIGVASLGVFIGIALVALSWWIWAIRKRRRQRQEEQQRQLDGGSYTGGKSELPSHSAGSSVASTPVVAHDDPVELAERRVTLKAYELGGSDHDTLAEVEGPPIVHELEGEWTGWEMSSARRSMQHSYDPTK